MKLTVRWLLPTAFVCLLISGAAGLIYQVVWARYLGLLLGHTSYAIIAVLVAFMGGLALGNAAFGRYADRLAHPLFLYAWLELGIALYGLLFPSYFEVCQRAYVSLGHHVSPGSPWLLALRFFISFAVILVPTTLMGGTLPVLVRMVTRSLGELRDRVARLYFINSLGAVLGVLIAEFWWIPGWGLDATVFGAVTMNFLAGITSLMVAFSLRDAPTDPPIPAGTVPVEFGGAAAASPAGARSISPGPGQKARTGVEEREEVYSPFEWRLAAAAAAISGFVAMLYEVVWTRVLALALGSSTHAFAIMLVTFISGITMGAWWVGRWRSLRRTLDAFGVAELALALSVLASMGFYHLLPYAFARLGAVIEREPGNFVFYEAAQFAICFAVMFVPTACLGMTLPLASRAATPEISRAGRSVGLVFSLNTLGTVLGAAVTGLVLLPALGLAKVFALGAGLNLVIAIAVLARRSERWRVLALGVAPLVVACLVALVHVTLSAHWDRAFALGLWRVSPPPPNLRAYLEMEKGVHLRFHRDGAGSTVVVHTWTNPVSQSVELTLRVNGKADATTRGDLPTQLLTGHLPLLLKTNVQDVMIVGIGSGMTCGAVLTHPSVRRVDAVEISPDVRDAASTLFAPFNHGALRDARVRVVTDDAKSFLRTSDRMYDVIVSEPSNPWMAGVAGVFSLEYYQDCRDRLRPGGLMAQWVQVYESDDETLRTVLATFTSVFPFASIWQSLPGDLILVGSAQPIARDLDAIQREFDWPAVLGDLRRADIFRLPVLLNLELVSEENTAFIPTEDTPRHSDSFPTLEYMAERGFFARNRAHLFETFDENELRRPATLFGDYLRNHALTVTDLQSFALFHTSFGLPRPPILRSLIEKWRDLAPGDMLPAEYSAKLYYPLPVSELEAERMARIRDPMMANAASEPEPLRMYSRHLMNAYRYLRSAAYQPPSGELTAVLTRLVETDTYFRRSHLLRLAEIAWDSGDDGRFLQLASEALVGKSGEPGRRHFDLDTQGPGRVLYLLIEHLWRERSFDDARSWCDAARRSGYLNPESPYYTDRLTMEVRKVETATLSPSP